MTQLLLVILMLLLVLMALLAIPLSFSFSITRKQALQGNARFSWLFGLITFQAQIPGDHALPAQVLSSPAGTSAPGKTTARLREVIALLKQAGFRQHVMKFIRRLLRASHARDLYMRLRIGLGDPADTGMLWAVMGPVSGMMQNLQGLQIDIEPEFIDPVMEFESHGQFRLIPIQFLGLSLGFILSPTTLRAWRLLRRAQH